MEELLPSRFGKQRYQDQQRHTIVKGMFLSKKIGKYIFFD